MLSTNERFTNDSPISQEPSVNFKNLSEIKPLRLFTELLNTKKKTAVRQVGDAKSKCKAIISGIML